MKDLRVKFPQPCSENYDDMKPQGCNRFCGSCEKTIHNLSHYEFDEAEQLLRSGEEICVRAKVNGAGEVQLKPNLTARRMVIAAGASIGMLTTSCQTIPQGGTSFGAIEGEIDYYVRYTKTDYIIAENTNGEKFKAKIKRDGKYKIKNLPVGEYSLGFTSRCESYASDGLLKIEADKITQHAIKSELQCIVVGALEIEENNG